MSVIYKAKWGWCVTLVGFFVLAISQSIVLADTYSTAVEGSLSLSKGDESDAQASTSGREFEVKGSYYFDPVTVKGSLTHRDYEQRISSASISYAKLNEDDEQFSETAKNTETDQDFELNLYVPDSVFYLGFSYEKVKIVHGARMFSPEDTQDVKLNLLSIGGFIVDNTSIGLLKLKSENSSDGLMLDLEVTGPFLRDIRNSDSNYYGFQLAALKGDFGNSAIRLYSTIRLLEVFYAVENTMQVGLSYQKLNIDRFPAESKTTSVNFIYAISHSMTVAFEHAKTINDSSDETENKLQFGAHF